MPRKRYHPKQDEWCECGFPKLPCKGLVTTKCERLMLLQFVKEVEIEKAEKTRRLNAQ